MRNRLFAVAVALLVLPATVLAATWTVKPDGTGDSPSIKAAILAASNGDVILLTDGTFSGAANRDFSYDKKAITIESVNGPTATIIDCGGLQGARFLRRETETSVLRGVTIVNASIGIECRPGSPLIENCVITGPVSWGVMAGVENNEILLPSSPRFENCTISNCSFGMVTLLGGDIRFNNSVATGCGSAYSAGRGFFTAKNSQFISNSSGVLFGLSASFLAGGSLTGCSFVGNTNTAVSIKVASSPYTVNVSGCYFENNHPAITLENGPSANIDGCTFVSNSSANGGAIRADSGGSLTVTNSIFCQNSSASGAAIYALQQPCTISGNTIVHNSSSPGAALHLAGSLSTGAVDNNLVAFNTNGPGILCESGANPTLSCNDIFANAGGDAICGTDGGNNISLEPWLCSQDCTDVGLMVGSPCAPENNACGVQIGARGVMCPVPVMFQNASARVSGKSVVVEWSVIADEEIIKFSIVRETNGSSRVIAERLSPQTRELVDDGVNPNTEYRYKVIATTGSGDVFQSQAIGVRTPRAELELSQNQPNPFNPSTRIDYSLPAASVIDIAVFDVAGRRVATLVAGPRPAGRGSTVWQGRDDGGKPVASGIYVCRMAANGDVRTMKMVLLK